MVVPTVQMEETMVAPAIAAHPVEETMEALTAAHQVEETMEVPAAVQAAEVTVVAPEVVLEAGWALAEVLETV